jgi:hypothetical protein
VGVVASEFLDDRTGRQRQLGDDAALAQDGQQRHEGRVRVARLAHRLRRATAVRNVLVQELLDAALVEPLGAQAAQRHPVREVTESTEVASSRALRVAASLQAREVRRNVSGQRAVEQPASNCRVKRRELGHGDLQ